MVYYSEDKRIRWDGAVVYKENLEQRHPQDLIKSVKENTSIDHPQIEPGLNSDNAAGYDYTFEAQAPTFALVDEFGVFIVTEDTIYIQVQPTAATLT
jgi:hypothetical protein